MTASGDPEERPLAWTAILARTPVFASDGTQVGVAQEVIGSEGDDIFHGVEVAEGPLGHNVLIPAERVKSITTSRISTDMSAEAIRQLPPYQPEESYRLGFVGLLRRRLGWVDDRRGNP
jgi:hypothetical protein